MTLYIEEGSPDREISLAELKQLVHKALDVIGKKKKVIIVPPDFTRFHSYVSSHRSRVLTETGTNVLTFVEKLGM